jgi:hypothetical protein
MKIRSDSLFAKLTPAQREELLQRCVEEGLSLEDGTELLRGWGVKSSSQALSRFVSTHGFAWRLERAKAAAAATQAAPSFEAEKSRLLQQKIFEAVADANCPPKVLVALRSLDLKAAEVKIQERRVALLEAKAQQADAVKAVMSDTPLTPEGRDRKIREILGL